MYYLGVPTTRGTQNVCVCACVHVCVCGCVYVCIHLLPPPLSVSCSSHVTTAGTCVTSDTRVERDIRYDGHPKMERATVVSRIAQTFLRLTVGTHTVHLLEWNAEIFFLFVCTVESLYRGHHWDPAGCPVYSVTSLYRTANWVPMVSTIARFHCIQDSQLGPNGVHYRAAPLYLSLCYSGQV